MAERVAAAFDEIPAERRAAARLIFTAHSIPRAMADRSPYERQLREACRLVADLVCRNTQGLAGAADWQLAYQSRSGPPSQSWLEPDISDCLRQLHAEGPTEDVVIAPIGFLVEHMEICYDLDVAVGDLCEELGINMVRTAMVGNHPRFVRMIRELVAERIDPAAPRLALGVAGPWPDRCPEECCPRPSTM